MYEAIVDEAAYAALPAMVARLVGGRAGVLQQFDADFRSIGLQYSYYSEQLVADLAALQQAGRDVWTAAGKASGIVGKAVPLDDLVPEPAFTNSALLNDVIRPHGDDTGRSVGLAVPLAGVTLHASVHRSFGEGPFTREHAHRLDALGSDLHRIYAARRLLRSQDDTIARLNHMLDAEEVRTLLVGRDLRLIAASPAAVTLLDRRDGMAVVAGKLLVLDPALGASLRQSVNRTIHRTGGEMTFLCRRSSGRPPWRLLVLPTIVDGASSCMITIGGPPRNTDRLRIWLEQHYGATAAEAQVADALMHGHSPEEIAAHRGVTINTVRTQVRQLLDKTGCRRITELVVLLTNLC